MRGVLPDILPALAVMIEVPTATAVTRPLLPTVATDVLDELQVTCEVISRVVPSANVPVAASCCVPCGDMPGLAGVMEMEDRVTGVTVRGVLPQIPPKPAVMVVVPAAMAVARPLLFTVATDVLDELQATSQVTSWVVP